MREQERREILHIISHCIADQVLTWRSSSAHNCICRRMKMIFEPIIAALSSLQQKLQPILGEVDKYQNRKGENNCTLYLTVQLLAYLLGGLIVHMIVFAFIRRCSWNKLSLLYELCSRIFSLLQERQINVRLGGGNDYTFYRTAEVLTYLLGGLIVHTIVFAVVCK